MCAASAQVILGCLVSSVLDAGASVAQPAAVEVDAVAVEAPVVVTAAAEVPVDRAVTAEVPAVQAAVG